MDQRPADVYALGKIGWALLSGKSVRAREEQSEPEWRLANLLRDPRVGGLDAILTDMISRDLRTRPSDSDLRKSVPNPQLNVDQRTYPSTSAMRRSQESGMPSSMTCIATPGDIPPTRVEHFLQTDAPAKLQFIGLATSYFRRSETGASS